MMTEFQRVACGLEQCQLQALLIPHPTLLTVRPRDGPETRCAQDYVHKKFRHFSELMEALLGRLFGGYRQP